MASIKNIGKKTEHAKHIYKKKKTETKIFKKSLQISIKTPNYSKHNTEMEGDTVKLHAGGKNKIDQNINF